MRNTIYCDNARCRIFVGEFKNKVRVIFNGSEYVDGSKYKNIEIMIENAGQPGINEPSISFKLSDLIKMANKKL